MVAFPSAGRARLGFRVGATTARGAPKWPPGVRTGIRWGAYEGSHSRSTTVRGADPGTFREISGERALNNVEMLSCLVGVFVGRKCPQHFNCGGGPCVGRESPSTFQHCGGGILGIFIGRPPSAFQPCGASWISAQLSWHMGVEIELQLYQVISGPNAHASSDVRRHVTLWFHALLSLRSLP